MKRFFLIYLIPIAIFGMDSTSLSSNKNPIEPTPSAGCEVSQSTLIILSQGLKDGLIKLKKDPSNAVIKSLFQRSIEKQYRALSMQDKTSFIEGVVQAIDAYQENPLNWYLMQKSIIEWISSIKKTPIMHSKNGSSMNGKAKREGEEAFNLRVISEFEKRTGQKVWDESFSTVFKMILSNYNNQQQRMQFMNKVCSPLQRKMSSIWQEEYEENRVKSLIKEVALLPSFFKDNASNLNDAIENTGKLFSALYKAQDQKLLFLALIGHEIKSSLRLTHHKKTPDELRKAFTMLVYDTLKKQTASNASWKVFAHVFEIDELSTPDIVRAIKADRPLSELLGAQLPELSADSFGFENLMVPVGSIPSISQGASIKSNKLEALNNGLILIGCSRLYYGEEQE